MHCYFWTWHEIGKAFTVSDNEYYTIPVLVQYLNFYRNLQCPISPHPPTEKKQPITPAAHTWHYQLL